MTTTPTTGASPLPAGLDEAAAGLVHEIERYLAARTRATAHPLVTRPTDELVAAALAELGTTIPSSDTRERSTTGRLPCGLWRALPDWALTARRRLYGTGRRQITVAEHLELTALVIEEYGWAHGRLRTRSGRRCILGAQAVLYRLGYGDEDTAITAGTHIQDVLAARGITQSYHQWNDGPGRSREEALYLVRRAADDARKADR